MKIFVNAGHGGTDPGAVSKHGFKEKDLTSARPQFIKSRHRSRLIP